VNSTTQEIPPGWILLSVSPKLSTASTEQLREVFMEILGQLRASTVPVS
jgi:hypothetical protein